MELAEHFGRDAVNAPGARRANVVNGAESFMMSLDDELGLRNSNCQLNWGCRRKGPNE